jgi:hypothetical protein
VYAARALDFSATYTHTGRFVNLRHARRRCGLRPRRVIEADLAGGKKLGIQQLVTRWTKLPHRTSAWCSCGRSSSRSLQASLHEALSVTPKQIYGQGACAEDPEASCFDMNRWVGASGISVPPFPFQNRPTFQQVVELTKTLPR